MSKVYFQIVAYPFPYLKGTIQPYNTTGLDALVKLIFQSGAIEFIQEPLLIKWPRFHNHDIESINQNEAIGDTIIAKESSVKLDNFLPQSSDLSKKIPTPLSKYLGVRPADNSTMNRCCCVYHEEHMVPYKVLQMST